MRWISAKVAIVDHCALRRFLPSDYHARVDRLPMKQRLASAGMLKPAIEHFQRKRILRRFGVKVEWWAHWRLLWAIAIVLVAAAAAWAVDPARTDRDASLQWIVPAILAAGVFIGSFFEWRSSRHEASLDKFYERLCIVNDSREKIRIADRDDPRQAVSGRPREQPTESWRPHVEPMQMYVWREVDNLEYVLERYRLGYLSTRLAFRGVATFASRLRFPQFEETLRPQEPQCLRQTAYHATTIEVVQRIAGAPELLVPGTEAAAPRPFTPSGEPPRAPLPE